MIKFLLKIFLVGFSVLNVTFCFSQELYSIKGQLFSSAGAKNNPVAYGNVTLLDIFNTERGSRAAGTDGRFEFSKVPPGIYKLSIKVLSYSTQTIDSIKIINASVDLKEILLEQAALSINEVNVAGKKSLLTQKLDKLIYNVEDDPDKNSQNMEDIFRKLPLVSIRGNETIAVNGTGVTILVDGKRSILFKGMPVNALKNLAAANFKSIEIITNPSAKYDSENQGAIINIVTKRKLAEGYLGSVKASGSTNDTQTLYGNLTVKSGKLGLNTSGTIQNYNQPITSQNYQKEDYALIQHSSLRGKSNARGNYATINAGISYELDSVTISNLEYGTLGTNGHFNSQKNGSITSSSLNNQYTLFNKSDTHAEGSSFNFDIQRNFRKHKAKSVTFSYQRRNDKDGDENSILQNSNLPDFNINNFAFNKTGEVEHALQLDFTLPFSHDQEIETGIKSTIRNNISEYAGQLYDSSIGAFITDPSTISNYTNDQYINGIYLTYSKSWKKFSMKLGARAEQTIQNAAFNTVSNNLHKNYTNVIPSLYLSQRLTDRTNSYLSYSKRIARPAISYLNPYVEISNPLNVSSGNQDLVPEQTNLYEVGLTFTGKLFIRSSIYFRDTRNSITSVSSLLGGITRNTFENIGLKQSAGFNFNSSYAFSKYFSLDAKLSANYIHAESSLFENSGWWYNPDLSLNFSLKNKMRIITALGYISPLPTLQGQTQGQFDSYLFISRDFFKRKLSTSIVGRTFLPWNVKTYTELNTAQFYQLDEREYVQQQFTLNISYNFGKLRTRVKRAHRVIDGDDFKDGVKKSTQKTQ